jgi:hypothetical protein
MARWFSVLVIALVTTSCSSSTEIPTVAQDPWATPEAEQDAGPEDAGPLDSDEFRPPCGNGDVNCDPRNLGGETCAGLGMGNGKLACDPVTCTYDTSMCEDDTSVGMGNGGNGGGNNNGSGNGTAGAGSNEQPPFFGGGNGGSGNDDDDESDGGVPFFGGQFFGGDGNGND